MCIVNLRMRKGKEGMTYPTKQAHEASAHEQVSAAVLALAQLLAHQATRELASDRNLMQLETVPSPKC